MKNCQTESKKICEPLETEIYRTPQIQQVFPHWKAHAAFVTLAPTVSWSAYCEQKVLKRKHKLKKRYNKKGRNNFCFVGNE